MPGDCASAQRRATHAQDRFDAFTENNREELAEYRDLEDKLWSDQQNLDAAEREQRAYAAWTHRERMEGVIVDREARRERAKEKAEEANQRVDELLDEIQTEIDAAEALATTDPAASETHLDRAAERDDELVRAEIRRDEAEVALEEAESRLEQAEAEYDRTLAEWDDSHAAEFSRRDMENHSRSKVEGERSDAAREARNTADRLSTGFNGRIVTEYDDRRQALKDALASVAQHCGAGAGGPPDDEDDEEEEEEEDEEEDETASGGQQDVDDAIAAEVEFLNEN